MVQRIPCSTKCFSNTFFICLTLIFVLPMISTQSTSNRTNTSNGQTQTLPIKMRRRLSTPSPFSLTSTHLQTSSVRQNLSVRENTTENSQSTENVTRLVFVVIICSTISVLTVVGNLFIILSVCLVRKLQTASNILIVSLAVSDILVGLFIMPLAIVMEISNYQWILGAILCDLWTSTDVLLCTSSILNFLIISIDRYLIINHPFKYAPLRKAKLQVLMISGVWVISSLVSLPPVFGWGRPSENLPVCQVNPELAYQFFATMVSFYIPLIIVLIIYANIYRTAQKIMETRSSVQMSQFLTHNNSSLSISNVSSPLARQQSNGNSRSSPQILLSAGNNAPAKEEIYSLNMDDQRSTNNINRSKSSGFLSPARCLARRISTPISDRLSIFVSRQQTFFRNVHAPNQKAIRTLGVILGTFIVCWLPFMLYALVKPLYKVFAKSHNLPLDLNAPVWLDSVLLWFGYSSSMLNPLIYSKFNRGFRLPFQEMLHCRCRGLNEKIRRQEYLENLYDDNHFQLTTGSSVHQGLSSAAAVRTSSHPEPLM